MIAHPSPRISLYRREETGQGQTGGEGCRRKYFRTAEREGWREAAEELVAGELR
jgi:hypothetical protein